VSAVELRRAAVGDIDVAYGVAGAGDPVVLVHGLAEDHSSWRGQQEAIEDHRTFAYDVRGHGATSTGDPAGTLEQLAHDLVGFLENVSGPAVCVGFSLGGTIVLRAAVDRPDLVKHAVVLGTSSIVGRAAVGFYAQRIELARSGDRDALLAAVIEDTAAGLGTPADAAELGRRRLEAMGAGEGYINAARAMSRLHEEPLTPLLGQVRCHVDVVGGERDAFCPRKAADILMAGLPDATYHEIPRVGHLMGVDDPAAVTRMLRLILDWRGDR
jgi:pimeloyl-ACP methyl ester carboxylesterase